MCSHTNKREQAGRSQFSALSTLFSPIPSSFHLIQGTLFASELYSELDNKLWLAEQTDLLETFRIFPASKSDSENIS